MYLNVYDEGCYVVLQIPYKFHLSINSTWMRYKWQEHPAWYKPFDGRGRTRMDGRRWTTTATSMTNGSQYPRTMLILDLLRPKPLRILNVLASNRRIHELLDDKFINWYASNKCICVYKNIYIHICIYIIYIYICKTSDVNYNEHKKNIIKHSSITSVM